jgi:TRAP-type transport system small permease protein
MSRILKGLVDAYYRALQFLLGLLMALMIVPVTLQIVSRYSDAVPRLIWTEEAARFCFVWIVMIGSMIAVRDSAHFDVDLLPAPRSERERGFARLVVHLAMALLAVVFLWFGVSFARFGLRQYSEMSGINMLSIYIAFPLAGATWLLFLSSKIADDVKRLFAANQLPGVGKGEAESASHQTGDN